jgi:hypothetical protein
MSDSPAGARLKSVLFITAFFLAAVIISYQLVRRDTDYVTVTINKEWRIYLIGESNVYALEYRASDFTQDKLDSRHIWLHGYGDLNWHNNTIHVHKTDIVFNNTPISKSHHDTLANILFAADGTVRKGMLEVRP